MRELGILMCSCLGTFTGLELKMFAIWYSTLGKCDDPVTDIIIEDVKITILIGKKIVEESNSPGIVTDIDISI